MHPPFYIVDHRAAPEPRADWAERPRMRRGGPARLDLSQPHPGTGTGFVLHDASGSPPARRPEGGGIWLRLRALLGRRPETEPAR